MVSIRFIATVCPKLMNTSRQGVYLVLLAATLWGSSGVSAQYLFRSYALSPGAVTMIRLLFSGLILTALGLLQGSQPGKMFRERSTVIRLIIFSVFGTLMVQLSFLITIEKTNAATATVLQFLAPVVLVLYTVVIRRKLPGMMICIAVLASLAGTLLMATKGHLTSIQLSVSGLIWGLISACAAAFNAGYSSELIRRFGTLSVTGISMLIAGVALVPFYLPGLDLRMLGISGGLALGYLVLIGTALTFSLFLKGAYLTGSQNASILSCAEPLSSAFLSVILLGVPFGLPEWTGSLLILFSVVLISLAPDPNRSARRLTEL